MKCFYHNDLDGRLAGFCVLKEHQDCQMIEMDYNKPFPINTIKEGELVYFVDFSIEPDVMKTLYENVTSNIIWIDHHVTAIAKYKDFPYSIRGIRNTSYAGCVLTYLFMSGFVNCDENFNDVPAFIRYVGDRDIWSWMYGDTTRFFCSGVELEDTSPSAPIWETLFNEDKKKATGAGSSLEYYIKMGSIVETYKAQCYANVAKGISFPAIFEGHRCIACNYAYTGSVLFDSIDNASRYDIRIVFYWDGEKWVISMYSATVDVGAIAAIYGGGGHKGAAGFSWRHQDLPFTKSDPFQFPALEEDLL
jgi:oligoribonuclease NrnB/cAMP/cGMP phosphodiesterase (DHH superfamily)